MFLGTDWTATRAASVVKFVRCEQCNHDYAYRMRRQIESSSFSVLGLDNSAAASRAAEDAERRVLRVLENSCDPVPCPECGLYQAAMVPRSRRIRLVWLWKFGITLIPLSIPAAIFPIKLFPPESKASAAGLICGSVLLVSLTIILARYWSNRRYDPNGKPVTRRIELGKRLVLSRKEYEEAIGGRLENG